MERAAELRRKAVYEDEAERQARLRRLEILEQGHDEAERDLEAMRIRWAKEDADTAAVTSLRRDAELARHEQGARDREAMRSHLGGDPRVTKNLLPSDVIEGGN
jgi:hypothetical protein